MLNSRFMVYTYMNILAYKAITVIDTNPPCIGIKEILPINTFYDQFSWINSERDFIYYIVGLYSHKLTHKPTSVGEFEIKLSSPVIEGKLICFNLITILYFIN